MAKSQIKNYVFKPGIGANDNLYPDAFTLLNQNREFLLSESIAYINQEIVDATKCQRDMGYIIDGLVADLTCQSTYYSYFIGLAEFNSLDISNTVVRTIRRVQADAKARAATHYTGTNLTNLNAEIDFYCNEVIDIAQNGRTAADLPTYSTVGVATDRVNAAVQVLQNFYFLAAEVNAWVDVTYPSHNHDVDKCSRDVIYALAAATFDILYTGNTASYDSAKFFNNYSGSGSTGITAAHKAQTVAAYRHLQSIIGNIITATPITKSAGNTLSQNIDNPASTPALGLEASNLLDIVADVVESGLGSLPTKVAYVGINPFPNLTSDLVTNKASIISAITWDPAYTYNSAKCQRDLGYVLDAYENDLRYGGNEKLRNTIKYYWDQDVAQVDGNRIPEIDTHAFIGELITDYIFTNTTYDRLGTVSQVVDLTKTSEATAASTIDTLVSSTVDVITNGLSSMPTAVPTGVGYVRIQGKWNLNELLLITNTTKNEIIYNFSGNSTGGIVTIKDHGDDDDFVKYLQTTDGVTTITLNYNTSSHSLTDELQIFVEEREVITRPYDFGTDAIERMRIATPMSMLDADFEYGLQPTKWSAIATLRGYPSVYEIPGTDTQVASIVTDASTGTEGIGASLITVTTVTAHGFEVGTPITIKAFENSVTGAARAEGSFVIVNVPSPTTFEYYAKAKVGTSNGQVLSTAYTQLREAGFYTGSSIGTPTLSVLSNGSSGTLSTQLNVLSGSSYIPFDGPSPEVGSPIKDITGAVTLGSQVTAIIDTSAGGGTYVTPTIIANSLAGTNTVTVETSTGIINGLSVDRGDGYGIEVVGVVGNTVEFSENFVETQYANKLSYTAVAGINEFSVGQFATFNISISGSSYVLDSIDNAGTGYQVGDRIIITGNELNGLTPENDALIVVDQVFSDNAIFAATITGTAFGGSAVVTAATGVYEGGVGTLAQFDVTWENNAYQTVSVTSPDSSSGYVVGDRIKILGSFIDPLGGDGVNDLYVTVDAIGLGGSVTSVSFAGLAPDVIQEYLDPPYTTSGAGSGASFNITADSGSYIVSVDLAGIDFLPGDTVVVSGTDLGGTSPTNDLTITVDNVGGLGDILTVSISGVAFNGSSASFLVGDNVVGIDATFDVTLAGGTYSVAINDPGSLYGVNQQLIISGELLYGTSPTNDLVITITGTDSFSTGTITSVSSSGTAYAGGGIFTGISGSNEQNSGINATFDLDRNFVLYENIALSNIGSGYNVGNRITIPGTSLDGGTPINDITIQVTNINVTGGITGFSSSYETADPGTNFDLISTIAISEPTVSALASGSDLTYEALATLSVVFENAHGLVPGSSFIVAINSDDGLNNHNLASGAYIATDIPTVSSLTFQARAAGTIDETSSNIVGQVYPRPDSFFIHRPYDGGVQLGTGGPQHGAQAIRQSKKYIRYQSGKGIMYTTGALFAPSYDLRSVTSDGIEVGSTITVVTDDNDHGLQVGGVIRLLGLQTPGYNSGDEAATPPFFDYTVIDIVDERTFKIRAQRRLGATTATLGFAAQMSVVSWHGATVRSGIFDDQNGIFWEYDGTNISVNQRTGTKQLAGTIAMQVDRNLVTGTNTRFRDQVHAGDRIIIKGMTHVVSHVIDNTTMTVTPDWRGVVDIAGTKANLVVDKKVKQEDFNLDRLDGTGPSGYNIDIAKMQMIGIQYSWYGAGFIDFMLRGSDGNFVFCHRMRNSNVNTEAFMRSGNLPVRYEVTNEGPPGILATAISDSQTTIPLIDASFFPSSGTLYIDNEIINFNGVSGNTLLNCTRGSTLNNFQAGADRIYSAGPIAEHEINTGVILISSTITPLISHWGSAFLTDGGFDEDRGYIFSYAESQVPVSTIKQTAFMIRLAPSVSNAIVGDLGERELLNRAQLLLQGIEITSDTGDGQGIVIEGVLNPQNFPTNPDYVAWSGLGSVAQGGQPSFAQIAAGGAITWTSGATTTTATPLTAAFPSGSITLQQYWWSGNYVESNRDYVLLRETDYQNYRDQGISPGDTFAHPNYTTTTIRSFGNRFNRSGVDYRWMYLNRTANSTSSSNNTATVSKSYRTSSTSVIWFDQTSFSSTNVTQGTDVTDNRFPAGTQVNTIQFDSYFGSDYVVLSFNNTSDNTTINPGTTTIEFSFSEPPYAQPGETVFSFIANPGERSTLSLAELKELTNTPLGGRGTFPNGPDVLAINVYKVSGTNINANIILRWGEAQA